MQHEVVRLTVSERKQHIEAASDEGAQYGGFARIATTASGHSRNVPTASDEHTFAIASPSSASKLTDKRP